MKTVFIQSIFQKYLVGLTGLGLFVFVFVHMMGNLLILVGPEVYNMYAHNLQNSLLVFFEVGLVILFLCHVVFAVFLNIKNYFARPEKYKIGASGQKATALYQKTLLIQGGIILIFVVSHLVTFKFGPYYEVTYKEEVVRDLFRLVVDVFQNPFVVIWYLVALFVLGVHLIHGLNSVFRSLGFAFEDRTGIWLNRLSWSFSLFVTGGFMLQPLYIFFFLGGGV